MDPAVPTMGQQAAANPGQQAFPSALQGKQFVQYNPLGSAYGTDHPADAALGKARFARGLANSSQSDTSAELEHTASLLNSGENPRNTGPMTTTMPSTPPTTDLNGTP